MKHKICNLLILIWIFVFNFSVSAQLSNELRLKIDELFREFRDDLPFVPGHTLHILKNNDWEYKSSIGISKLENNSPMKDDLTFKQASITKLFNSTVIMKLVQDNLLRLDDPINQYLTPNQLQYFTYANEIKISQLLQHTSGLVEPQNDFQGPMNRWIFCMRNEDIPKDSLLFWSSGGSNPGQFWYANTNYVLLALIIESVTGKTYQEAIIENIIQPFGLTSTTFDRIPSTPLMDGYVSNNFFPGACTIEVDSVINFTLASNSWGYGSADLWSNTKDLISFMKAWKENRLFNNEIKNLQLTPNVLASDRANYGNGIFKFNLLNEDHVYAFGHSGSAFGYGSQLIYIPEYDMYICGASNFMKVSYIFLMEKLYILFKSEFTSNTKDPDLKNIKLKINPFSQNIILENIENDDIIRIDVIDPTGNIKLTSVENNIDASILNTGIYFIKINTKLGQKTLKAIKI